MCASVNRIYSVRAKRQSQRTQERVCACALRPLEGRQSFGLIQSGDLAILSDVWREAWKVVLSRQPYLEALVCVRQCVSTEGPHGSPRLVVELVRTGGRAFSDSSRRGLI